MAESVLSGQPFLPATTRVFLDERCQEGNAGACRSLGVMLDGGHSGAVDAAAAYAAFRRACELGSEGGCVHKATSQLLGIGAEKDEVSARAVLQGLCSEGTQSACEALKGIYIPTSEFILTTPGPDRETLGRIGRMLRTLGEPVIRVQVRLCVDVDGSARIDLGKGTGIAEADAALIEALLALPYVHPTRGGTPVHSCLKYKLNFRMQ
ncbi:MAG: hypothetical protein IPK80_34870 [Nannocystis sp.]|nr:hypothetical protein [Nannocystis sp.]